MVLSSNIDIPPSQLPEPVNADPWEDMPDLREPTGPESDSDDGMDSLDSVLAFENVL